MTADILPRGFGASGIHADKDNDIGVHICGVAGSCMQFLPRNGVLRCHGYYQRTVGFHSMTGIQKRSGKVLHDHRDHHQAKISHPEDRHISKGGLLLYHYRDGFYLFSRRTDDYPYPKERKCGTIWPLAIPRISRKIMVIFAAGAWSHCTDQAPWNAIHMPEYSP
jgi:hypothetical protein